MVHPLAPPKPLRLPIDNDSLPHVRHLRLDRRVDFIHFNRPFGQMAERLII
jgi:hypothetical protein